MKKLILFILIFLLSFSIFLIIFLSPKDYSTTYLVDNYEIKETYYKKYQTYYFEIKNKKEIYSLTIYHKYNSIHNLVENIKYNDKTKQINISILNNNYKLCNINSIQTDCSNNYQTKAIKEYKNISIYNYPKPNIAIWNYRGFHIVNKDTFTSVNLFNKDIYDTSLITQYKELLIIPDYNQNYEFNRIYLLNIETCKYEIINLDNYISYNSRILGIYEELLYIIDEKNKIEYTFNLKNYKLNKIGDELSPGLIYNGELITSSILNIINHSLVFTNQYLEKYEVKDNNLIINYPTNKMIITSDKNIKILSQSNDYLLYLINDEVYYYNILKHNILLLKYFELNFNYQNKIFIY